MRAAIDDIEEAYGSLGAGAAWGKFVSLVMHDGLVTEAGVPPATWPPPGQDAPDAADQGEPPAPSAKQEADDELFFLRMLKPFTRYEPEVDTLRSGAPRVLVAVGEPPAGRSHDARPLLWLIDSARPPVTFPGDHGGFMSDPVAFADRIRQVLRETD